MADQEGVPAPNPPPAQQPQSPLPQQQDQAGQQQQVLQFKLVKFLNQNFLENLMKMQKHIFST